MLNLNREPISATYRIYGNYTFYESPIDEYTRISCITLQETLCDDSSDMSKFILPGYTMITKYKRAEVSDHGGLIIYVHNDFYFNEIQGNQSLTHEALGVEIWHKDSSGKMINNYVIFSVYRVPTGLTPGLLTFINNFNNCCDGVNLIIIIHCFYSISITTLYFSFDLFLCLHDSGNDALMQPLNHNNILLIFMFIIYTYVCFFQLLYYVSE